MSATLLANELSNLSSEAKRKNTALRNAADKSLQELKALPATSEQQLAADLSRRPSFIEPFLIACNTRNARFAASGVSSLQRLVISKGLPKQRLQDALDAFNACTDLGLDIQLKILQALPSLLQNYATELEGELLGGALQVCSSLQAAKASTVSGVAAATLQQLVATVFEKVASEDKSAADVKTTTEVPGDDGPIPLRPAAYDACRVLRDLALAADERKTKFVALESLSAESSLELIWSCVDANPELFKTHAELLSIIGSNILPLVVRALSEKLAFSVTVRSIRLLDLILNRYMSKFPGDCEVALDLCTQTLEAESAPLWKRALVLEVLRDFFTDGGHIIDAYLIFDGRENDKKSIVQDLMSAFVRLSTEKPGAIGLGQQSTVPTGPAARDFSGDTAALEAAGGMAGVLSSAMGVAETNAAGISTQWSLPKIPCKEQLDKNEPPAIPETYPYALVLECLNGLSDSLARVVLPLTVQREKSQSRSRSGVSDADQSSNGRSRSTSFRTRTVPVNPLEDPNAPHAARMKAIAGLVDTCWPAVLATSSTFLNAALDDQYFRNLIKAYQRFAQVAGLLRLITPRDALMTTLAKAAIPPHVFNAATSDTAKSPSTESPRVFSNAKSLLSVDSLVSQASSLSIDKDRRASMDVSRPMLTVRNLLCLRALLNLAIALGPTLGQAFAVILSALKQADMVLSTTTPQQMSRQSSFWTPKGTDPPSVVQAFSAEVASVEAAASRLLESTSDYPNDAFITVLRTFCQMLQSKSEDLPSPASSVHSRPTSSAGSPISARRTFSGLPRIGTFAELRARDYQFVIPKLGTLAELNVSRFVHEESNSSGWACLVDELLAIARTNATLREARRSATNVLLKLAEATIAYSLKEDPDERAAIQRRALTVLLRLVDGIFSEEDELSSADLELQNQVLDSLRAILERCGDSLLAGWNRIIGILCSAFEYAGTRSRGLEDDQVHINWSQVSFDLVSTQIGRTAFSATQLMCSDFLESLPSSVVPSLVELLYRFMCQQEDLNAALTTVSMAWNVSDFLFNACSSEAMDALITQAHEFEEFDTELQSPRFHDSKPAQWLLLLIRLGGVAARPLKEIRNAAFQTICSVFKSHGEELSPAAWDLLVRNTLFHIARADSYSYMQEDENKPDPQSAPDMDMSQSIIAGTSQVLAQHLGLIEQIAKLPSLWEVLLSTLERYLDVNEHSLNAAVYSAVTRILSGIDACSSVWKGPTFRTLSLWLKGIPHAESKGNESNQDAFVAYVESGKELYRLTRDTMSTSQTRTMINNLYQCVKASDGPSHGGDINNMSPLQTKVLQLLRNLRMDQADIAPCLITVAGKLATLHHESRNVDTKGGPTFVAIADEATAWLQELVVSHAATLTDADVLSEAIEGLEMIIQSKYTFRTERRGMPLWRRATSTALALSKPLLEQPNADDRLWSAYIGIAAGIVKANDLQAVEDPVKIHNDQLFDVESFQTLKQILNPKLPQLSDATRQEYIRALYDASIIHQHETGEICSPEEPPLKSILRIRRGRVKPVPYSRREDMAYVCWKELVALGPLAEEDLLLRCAIPIRAYIADQPLRGRKPIPLSELEELLFCFETVKKFGEEELSVVYPLLIQAVGTAGDKWSGGWEVLRPLQGMLREIAENRTGTGEE
ncbi:related to MON2 Peripheral membrane with a role in endocytosis and vacuole integrity [Lecanosticta acicola]|uniref:Related to MON2 Peripheral membrane with a role in endocytosis and vacuole integrity n=1 Tax=Lecanosticta acicola TaxID=111012 RepID=A0AAI8Z7L0_9PEZI|nr:related to MON2 Peripheral membrane with a role in endocytosis and vacuole integrity [Lecanosticta acicola]